MHNVVFVTLLNNVNKSTKVFTKRLNQTVIENLEAMSLFLYSVGVEAKWIPTGDKIRTFSLCANSFGTR